MTEGAPMAAEEPDSLVGFLEQEGVPRGARLLDVPCGVGRRAIALAHAGFHVVAVDPNEVGIGAARQRIPREAQVLLTFAAAPREALPGLPAQEQFDAILCLDHALTRGSVDEDVAFLSRIARHMKAEGRLILDFLNRDFFASRPRPFAFHVLGRVEQHEFRRFDPVSGTLHFEWKFYERTGDDLRYRTSSSAALRLIPPDAVTDLLCRAGFRVLSVYGGWDRTPMREDRRKFQIVAALGDRKRAA